MGLPTAAPLVSKEYAGIILHVTIFAVNAQTHIQCLRWALRAFLSIAVSDLLKRDISKRYKYFFHIYPSN